MILSVPTSGYYRNYMIIRSLDPFVVPQPGIPSDSIDCIGSYKIR